MLQEIRSGIIIRKIGNLLYIETLSAESRWTVLSNHTRREFVEVMPIVTIRA